MVLVVKSCLTVQEMPEMWVRSLSQEDILEKEMAMHPVYLPMEILWTEEPGGPQSVWSLTTTMGNGNFQSEDILKASQ